MLARSQGASKIERRQICLPGSLWQTMTKEPFALERCPPSIDFKADLAAGARARSRLLQKHVWCSNICRQAWCVMQA